MTDVLYRYDYTIDFSGRVTLSCESWYVIKETPCGHWISPYKNDTFSEITKRFMKKQAIRPFAHEDKKEALRSFCARKRAEILHNERRVENARAALNEGIRLLHSQKEDWKCVYCGKKTMEKEHVVCDDCHTCGLLCLKCGMSIYLKECKCDD